MDLSVISYFLIPPVVLIGVFLFFPSDVLIKIESIFLLVMVFVVCLLVSSNIIVYHYWGTLLNFRALSYLNDYSEISSSFTILQFILIIILLLLFIIFSFYFFKKFGLKNFKPVNSNPVEKVLHWILIVVFTIVFMRGGIQMLPMNESLVSVSDNNFINQATINPGWHLANDIYRAGVFEGNPFESMPEDEAERKVKKLFACDVDSFPQVLTIEKPNIVIIILESFTADVVGVLNGEKNISPVIDSLSKEGILFSGLYSSGTRTDQGIVSILNGWPATPFYSIMRSSDKSAHMPSLPLIFKNAGYKTSFYYGGQSNFSNMNVYLLNHQNAD
jgi:phosphoglycerol transferase MdoB-like AlkP superfamily enzyme